MMRIDARRTCSGTVLMFLLLALPHWVHADMDRWVIDEEHFAVGFLVDHIGFARVLGMFLRAEGHFLYDPETMEIGGGEWVIHTDSVLPIIRKGMNICAAATFLTSNGIRAWSSAPSAGSPPTTVKDA